MPTTHDRAPDPRPARTKAAIFAAARDLTASDGEVTVNALAKRAGVSRAAFYSHFSGLDSLMGEMLQGMFDTAWVRGAEYAAKGASTRGAVKFGFGMLVAYVERHHAFLRGALDWKFSHRTFKIMIDMMTTMHTQAMGYLKDDVPAWVRPEAVSRLIAGGVVSLCVDWLLMTEDQARDGLELDATELLTTILQHVPSWYTGLDPEGELEAAELLEICRNAEPAAPPGG